MIVGIGTDLLDIDRVTRVYAIHGDRFVKRILTVNERSEAQSRSSIVNYLAKQFAAKEAISKALGVGIGALSFQDIEVLRDANGKPCATLSSRAKKTFDFSVIHISLSDTKNTVLAFCVVEK